MLKITVGGRYKVGGAALLVMAIGGVGNTQAAPTTRQQDKDILSARVTCAVLLGVAHDELTTGRERDQARAKVLEGVSDALLNDASAAAHRLHMTKAQWAKRIDLEFQEVLSAKVADKQHFYELCVQNYVANTSDQKTLLAKRIDWHVVNRAP